MQSYTAPAQGRPALLANIGKAGSATCMQINLTHSEKAVQLHAEAAVRKTIAVITLLYSTCLPLTPRWLLQAAYSQSGSRAV